MVSHNSCGFKTKGEEVLQDLCVGDHRVPEVIFLQETNVKQADLHLLPIPGNWAAVFNAAPVGHMHGCGILVVRKLLSSDTSYMEPIIDISTDRFDILGVKVEDLVMVNVYLHVVRDNSFSAVLDDVVEIISTSLIQHSGPVIIGGDFNCPRHAELLQETMEALELHVALPEDGPTPTHGAGGVLDWIFYRAPATSAGPLQVLPRGLDHAVLRADLLVPIRREKNQRPRGFNWRRFRVMPDEERQVLQQAVHAAAKEAGSLSAFRQRITTLLEHHLGRLPNSNKVLPNDWFDSSIDQARARCRQAERAFHRAPTRERQAAMQEARRSYRSTMRRRKRQSEASKARRVETRPSSIYRLAASKKGPRFQARVLPDKDKFVKFWDDLFSDDEPIQHDWRPDGEDTSCEALPITFEGADLKQAIGQIATNKAPGEDDIRIQLFRGMEDEFYDELASLFTAMANEDGPLPEWMTHSHGVTLYKNKGSRRDPANYRIIVMAPLFAKLYEKMLENRGRKLLAEGLLDIAGEQMGFMPQRSTHDSMFILESLRDGQIKNKGKLFAAFLDLRKAFDTVSHKTFIKLLYDRGAPVDWIQQLTKMLANRKLKLLDALISLQVGTVQGSPISPLLFILFINPLIERIKEAGKGVPFAGEGSTTTFIRCLLFADDVCLVAESIEDLENMLEACRLWASEFKMRFNASKSEVLMLAGRLPEPRPPVHMGDEFVPWVNEVKYLGIPLKEGRRARLDPPKAKMWGSYHRIKAALDPTLPIPVRNQLRLIESDILSLALYPTPVKDTKYDEIDRFINRLLNRIAGTQQRWTSATFLRAELGVWPSKFLAHRRALTYYWHLRQETWMGDLLSSLRGPGPMERFKSIAEKYGVKLADATTLSKAKWRSCVDQALAKAVAEHMNAELASRGLSGHVEPGLSPRPYIVRGGDLARAGFQYRWLQAQRDHHKLRAQEGRLPVSLRAHALLHHPRASNLPIELRRMHKETTAGVLSELIPGEHEECPAWAAPHLRLAMETIQWPKQTKGATRQVLALIQWTLAKTTKTAG